MATKGSKLQLICGLQIGSRLQKGSDERQKASCYNGWGATKVAGYKEVAEKAETITQICLELL